MDLGTGYDPRQREEEERQYAEDMRFLDSNDLGSSEVGSPTAATQRQMAQPNEVNLPSGFAAYAGSHNNTFGGHPASDGVLTGQGQQSAAPAWQSSPLINHWTNTTGFANTETEISSGSASSPDGGSSFPSPRLPENCINPKKRHRESLSLTGPSTGNPAKAMRATPSPAMTGTTTPSSLDSFEIPDDPDFFRLMGGDPKEHIRDMREEQKSQEKVIREKREQERKDEELARQLEQEYAGTISGNSSTNPRGAPSIAPRATYQTFLDTQAKFRRPVPLFSSSPPTIEQDLPQTPTLSPVQQELARQDWLPQTPVNKKENVRKPLRRPTPFTTDFIDLGSDDEFDDNTGHPSSDLVEVDPNSWRDSGGRSKPNRTLPWMENTPTNQPSQIASIFRPVSHSNASTQPSQYGASYQGSPGYGGTNVYDATSNGRFYGPSDSSSWGQTAGQMGQTLVNTVKGAANAAYSILDNQINSYPGTTPGYSNSSFPYGMVNSSMNSSNFIDLDNYAPPYQNAVQSVLSGHSINVDDPLNQDLVDKYIDRYNYLTNDPTRTTAEIKSLLENIRPDEDLPPENREGTPDAMKYPLMEHQKLGLAWMMKMEEGSNKGGILADDMGLGKTIQALALMVHRRSPDPNRKTNLIVGPVALMKQWEREIQVKLKSGREHRLTTYILHGSNRQTSWEHLKTFDVVLTTFGTLANEIKRKEGIDMAKRANANWVARTKADQLPLLGDECRWYRVIIDEAQCIKNKNTKASLGACALQAVTRFCMSGTPMMNNVGELYSLIRFLRIKPYNVIERFNRDFTNPLKRESDAGKGKAMQQLQALLKAILLRRTKKSKIDGRPILSLPERTTEAEHAVFDEDEQAFYRALESQTQLQFNKYLKAGTVGRNYSNVLVLLLRLRQACCHPHLIKDFGMSSGIADLSVADMIKLAKELAPDVVARIKEQGESALECPVCMDSSDNATIFIPCGHSTCSECFARISDPSQAIAGGDANEGRNADIKCPNCRGKIVLAKIIDHNAFKRAHMPETVNAEEADLGADEESASDSDSDSDSDDDQEDTDDPTLGGFVVDDDVVSDGTESEDEEAEGYRKGRTPFEKSSSKPVKPKKSKKSKGKGKVKEDRPPRKSLAQLKKEGMRNAKARKRYLKRLKREWIPSGKILKTLEILQATQDRQEGEKTIIFSQFTSLLDLLEVPIADKGWGYKRYDGSMSSNSRNEAVIEFSDKPECKIMLVSLKAGNSGLNLVAASQVIIFDPFWNPYIEEQAIDRAHRIGQLRPVMVHRILVPETVEDRILALQEKKRALIEGALDEKASQNIGRLGTRELAFLFVRVAPPGSLEIIVLTSAGCTQLDPAYHPSFLSYTATHLLGSPVHPNTQLLALHLPRRSSFQPLHGFHLSHLEIHPCLNSFHLCRFKLAHCASTYPTSFTTTSALFHHIHPPVYFHIVPTEDTLKAHNSTC